MRLRNTLAAALLAPLVAGCGEGSTDVGLADLEIVVASGDEQFGPSGQDLAAPLVALVRELDTRRPRAGVEVAWRLVEGEASFPTGAVGTTREDGTASVTVRLGGGAGTVRIRAELGKRPEVGADFAAFVVERPILTGLSAQNVTAGDTVTLFGDRFSTVNLHNVVLFSGIRGRVLSGTESELRVEVPLCLPSRTVQVTAQLGALVSEGLSLQVVAAANVPTAGLAPRQSLDVDDREGLTCISLDGDGGAGYLLITESAGTVGAARYGVTLRGLSDAGTSTMGVPGPMSRELAPTPSGAQGAFAAAFEWALRGREAELATSGVARAETPLPRAPTPVPTVGERRTFKVLNADQGFDDVQAVALYVGERAAFYVDEAAPGGGFTSDDLAGFSADFDEVIGPTITQVFGGTSDLDGNERIVILFTATVNGLTPRGSDGFVGGFFYGLDLLDQEGSNRAEVFYAMVPDPDGIFGDPRSKSEVLQITPAILAHELQHMVHFNERVLVRGAGDTEALWLSEGLAQMSEELVARAFYERGEASVGDSYRSGNLVRARRYLAGTSEASLIVATGQGSLAERGAGWLHTLFLWDAEGGDDLLGRLTRTTRTGIANIEATTGRTWLELFSDWAAALYLDDLGSQPYAFEYPSVDLRALLATSTGAYPLAPEVLGFTDFGRTGRLWSASFQQYIVVPPSSGRVALRFAGEAGAAAPLAAAVRLRIVRLF
ncbi:MAG TPA: hypothetical protein VK849_09205 [Longimicrobiales bacterium]|nr:hypothetical protein [Longimicrobiales bacterium]